MEVAVTCLMIIIQESSLRQAEQNNLSSFLSKMDTNEWSEFHGCCQLASMIYQQRGFFLCFFVY